MILEIVLDISKTIGLEESVEMTADGFYKFGYHSNVTIPSDRIALKRVFK